MSNNKYNLLIIGVVVMSHFLLVTSRSLEIAASDDCVGECVCTKIFLPVCDSLGKKHHNICIFECSKKMCPGKYQDVTTKRCD